jgi:uncharacterized RDD family membrane protein YckC
MSERPWGDPGADPRSSRYPGGYGSQPPPGAFGPPAAGAAPAVRYELASWWSRVGATLIDGLIIGVGALLIAVLLGAVFSVGFFASDETSTAAVAAGVAVWLVAATLAALLYAPLMMARTDGKTLGRMAVGIRVVRAKGGPMTFGFALLREVVVKTFLFGVIGSVTAGLGSLIDVLWPLWDDENRALHDFIVDTRVVRD